MGTLYTRRHIADNIQNAQYIDDNIGWFVNRYIVDNMIE